MDILLIYPPLSVDERYGSKKLGSVGGNLPPLGIMYIAAFLREQGFEPALIDGPGEDMSEDDILNRLNLLKPKVVGLSAITPVFHRAENIAKKIKERFPDILILIGGHHASILPNKVLGENASFDLLIYGEGELTVFELMQKYKALNFDRAAFLNDVGGLSNIRGIAFRKQEEIVITSSRAAIQNLDTLPYPAWDLVSMNRYIPLPNQYLNKPVVHMVSVRGCPFQCSFCSNNVVFGRKIRAISPERLVQIINYTKANFKAKEISFWDDCMTVNKAWLLKFCSLMCEKKLNITWSCYGRVDTIDKEMLRWMKKAGCWNIFYGFESGNQELLDAIDKKITLEQIRNVNKWTKEAGIEVRASFMLALPGETPEMAEKTVDFAISLDPDYVQFCITTPFPETKLFSEAEKHGRVINDFSKYNIWEPVFIPNGYRDREHIEAVAKRAFRRFYFRPKYIVGRLKKIRTTTDLSRYYKGLKMALGFTK